MSIDMVCFCKTYLKIALLFTFYRILPHSYGPQYFVLISGIWKSKTLNQSLVEIYFNILNADKEKYVKK